MKTHLFSTVVENLHIWQLECSEVYTARRAYTVLMEMTLDTSYLHVCDNWRALWKLKIPPKVKHFLWRVLKST